MNATTFKQEASILRPWKKLSYRIKDLILLSLNDKRALTFELNSQMHPIFKAKNRKTST